MEMRESLRANQRAAEIMRAAGDLWQLASTLGQLCGNLVSLGRLDEVRQTAQELLPLAERLGNYGALWYHCMTEGMVDFLETGDPDALEAFARRSNQLCEHGGMAWVSLGWSWLALAEFLRGNWETAILHAETAEGLAPASVLWGVEWALHFEYRAYAGQRDEALAMLDARRAELPRWGEPGGWGGWLMLLSVVEGLIVLGEMDQAAELYPLVRHCMERTRVVNTFLNDARLLERIAAMAAAAGSQWEAAEAHFARALEQAERLPHRLEKAHTQRFYGRFLLERGADGDPDRARSLLQQAVAGYRSMRMPRHEAMARELLTRTGTARSHG
jgi:tetratricopeptide (TPR) repeat protein